MAQMVPKFSKYTPREYLNSQERILFDTRPHFASVVGLGLPVWLIIGSILFLGLAAVAGPAAGVAVALWLLIVILPFTLRAMGWRKVFYSLTNQRIIVGSGLVSRKFHAYDLVRTSGMIDASTYRITGVSFSQGIIGRLFGFGDIRFETNRGSIEDWSGTKDPLDVRRQIEQTVYNLQEARSGEVTYTEQVIRKVADIRTEQQFGLIPPSKTDVPMKGVPTQANMPSPQGDLPSTQTNAPSGQPRYCTNCGQQNTMDAVYCNRCGKQLQPEQKSRMEAPLPS